MKVFDDLEARGLVKQTTNTEKIRTILNDGKITFYIGFDPTADSLHVGHLLGLITAKRLSDAGHRAILLVGGATATVGDPTGKAEMRKQLSLGSVHINALKIGSQVKQLVPNGELTNNMAWFDGFSFLSMLQDIAPHFSVNNMLRADCFKSRMENGLSFLEFNYMIMQATDFLKLHEDEGCVLQIGGDDQWSNMLAGKELIHKKLGTETFAMTFPLLTTSDGKKMGKTEKGTVWLDPEKTSPFDFFQFWRNIPDDKVRDCLNFFTFSEPQSSKDLTGQNINWSKKLLAFEVTKLVHGQAEATKAMSQAESLFEKQDASIIQTKEVVEGTQLLDLLVQNGFAKSKTDGRNLIGNKGITINNNVVTDPLLIITRALGNDVVIKRGKKQFARFLIKETNET